MKKIFEIIHKVDHDNKFMPWRLSMMEIWHVIEFDGPIGSREIYESLAWICDNCEGKFSYRNISVYGGSPKPRIYFEKRSDALAYKLTWKYGR